MDRDVASVGDKLWTRLNRVSKGNNVLAESPYNAEWIFLNPDDIEDNTPIEVPPAPVRSPTKLDGKARMNDAVYFRISSVEGGSVGGKVLPREQGPESCPIDLPALDLRDEFDTGEEFEKHRDEPVEWRGTKQDVSEEKVKNRTEVFKEDDIRGDKNDLLGGNL